MANTLDKLLGGRKPPKRIELDSRILQRGKISFLTLDERWNSLFKDIEKTPAIQKCEDDLNGCLKEQARLTKEQKDGYAEKRRHIRRINELTREAFGKNNAGARGEIADCEAAIKRVNTRAPEIAERLSILENEVRNANMELLETSVSHVYFSIQKSRLRARELDGIIQSLRTQLQDCIEEQALLTASYAASYENLHDLLGAAQIEELDKLYSP